MSGSRTSVARACLFGGALLAPGIASAQVSNGSFETGDFTGWTAFDTQSSPFQALAVRPAGSFAEVGGFFTNTFTAGFPVTDGSFSATHGFDGSGGSITIAQDAFINGATLSFDWGAAVLNYSGAIAREFNVNIRDSAGGTLLDSTNIVSIGLGQDDTGIVSGQTVDVSAFIGSTVNIEFEWTVPEPFAGPAGAFLDNVAIVDLALPVEFVFGDAFLNGGVDAETSKGFFSDFGTSFPEMEQLDEFLYGLATGDGTSGGIIGASVEAFGEVDILLDVNPNRGTGQKAILNMSGNAFAQISITDPTEILSASASGDSESFINIYLAESLFAIKTGDFANAGQSKTVEELSAGDHFFGFSLGAGVFTQNPEIGTFTDSASFNGQIIFSTVPGCNAADLVEPYGILDFGDVLAFLTGFGAGDPVSDLSEPLGIFDFDDVLAFLTAFGTGCP